MGLFKTHSERELKRLNSTVKKIEDLRDYMISLDDSALQNKTEEFKTRYNNGETLEQLLPEAFAVVREATRRLINQEHFRVQLFGGIILHQGRIAEMKTGEGKSQTALLPAYLNAISGKTVFIVTVNDYLAKRDAVELGKILEFLGVSVGCITNDLRPDERKKAYNCGVTYVTNNELGFDYLRDNMAIREEQCVLRGLDYAIIDEVDSILIDEARTPLIISGAGAKSTKLYEACDIFVRQLKRGSDKKELSKMDYLMGVEDEEDGDFTVSEKDKTVNLTAQGVEKAEKFFHVDNLSDFENLELQHNITLALRAHNLMSLDKDYIVRNDEVLIVDEFTGRVMEGRRFSDGLHQAIEAKEHVKIKKESQTLATITFQNFFNKFEKKAGMTGTALTEEKEFRDIYGMDVVCVPTNMPMIRIDEQDMVYKTKKEKYEAIIEKIVEAHSTGQPILVGTITIETSELISKMLSKRGIKHNVLNAKYHELEAQIVADAGIHGAVTIATNMAGRGTDIKLDDEARKAGGLLIIGTERHESRRIDNQLRGRSGRQGDPGQSVFYISLEDDVMRLFGSEKLQNTFNNLGVPDGQEIHHKFLSKTIENAQKKIESNNFSIRKNVLEYDQVMNEQREIIYGKRNEVLQGKDVRKYIINMISEIVEEIVQNGFDNSNEDNLEYLNSQLLDVFNVSPLTLPDIQSKNKKQLIEDLTSKMTYLYEEKEKEFETEEIREIERIVLLRVIDTKWMMQLDDMDQLKQGIGLQAYGQRDPKVEYKIAGYDLFNDMISNINKDTLRALYRVKKQEKIEREEVMKATSTNKMEKPKTIRKIDKKVYPNDKCPCGSGKKYKNCCMRKVS